MRTVATLGKIRVALIGQDSAEMVDDMLDLLGRCGAFAGVKRTSKRSRRAGTVKIDVDGLGIDMAGKSPISASR